jgi:murein DD-endopeptidase MepM/ murein hydrolase activator NlpD
VSEEIFSSPTTYRQKLGTARLEEDDFVINDVPLKIPPSQIGISKKSYLNQWSGLRLATPQKTKSGQSLLSVTASVVFNGNDSINNHMRKVIAGLKATPFCVVYNKYVSRSLSEVSGKSDARESYKKLKPVVLALTSMTFSTIPGKPDCIFGQFEFIWFNYLPYTPIWAYKTGMDFNTPGAVEDSELWKQFYKPFLNEMKMIEWPHMDPTREKTYLRWRDFSMRPIADVAIQKKSKELVETLLRKPTKALSAWKSVLNESGSNLQNSIDRWYNKLVDSNVISGGESKALQDADKGILTRAATDVLSPALKKVTPHFYHGKKNAQAAVNENLASVQSAMSEIDRRIKYTNTLTGEESDFVWEEMKEYSANAEFQGKNRQPIANGGFTLYGRKRTLRLGPAQNSGIGGDSSAGIFIQGMSVSISTSVAIIPMVGHMYPTCQFTGGYDTDLDITINARNDRMYPLQDAYDKWNKSNLRFRMLPQAVRNVRIDNDFAALFGITEVMAKSFETTTLPDQPGRSQGILSLTSAGIKSDTKFDNPEQLYQEFIGADPLMRQEIWKVLEKYIVSDTGSKGHLITWKGPIGNRDVAFFKLLQEAIEIYNEFMNKVMGKIFSGNNFKRSWMSASDGARYWDAFSKLSHSLRGPVHGLERMKASVEQRKRRGEDSHRSGGYTLGRQTLQNYKDNKSLRQEYASMAGQKIVEQTRSAVHHPDVTLKRIEIELEVLLNDMGLQTYQNKMRNHLDKIDRNHLRLKQFKHLQRTSERLGLGRGKNAYPDFAPSLASIGAFLDAGFSTNTLIEYDPDVYMWYPAYNGALASPLLGSIIDTNLLRQAKNHSKKIFESAQGDVGNFFQGTYRTLLNSSQNKAPLKSLDSNLVNGAMSQDLYTNSSYSNSTRNQGEMKEGNIKLKVVPDPSKTPSNYYLPEHQGVDIVSDFELNHTTNFDDLWGGVDYSSDPSRRGSEAVRQDGQPTLGPTQSLVGPTLATPSVANANLGIEDMSIEFSWPPKKSEQSPNKNGLVCPVESYRAVRENLSTRNIGRTVYSFKGRARGAVLDWKRPSARKKLQKEGFSDPGRASAELGVLTGNTKPVNRWTFHDYKKWSRQYKKKLGYVHKGVDAYGQVGTEVYAVADGVVRHVTKSPVKRAGLFIEITHKGNSGIKMSRYMHLQAVNPYLKRGKKVSAGDHIGALGRSGYPNTSPHLHFEVWDKIGKGGNYMNNGSFIDPLKEAGIPWRKGSAVSRRISDKAKKRLSQLAQRTLGKDVTSSLTSPLTEAVNEFEKSLIKGQAQRVVRAYPTFKLYFVEDDSGQRKRLAFDDFFSYNSVKSIRVVKSRKIPADLCVLELVNISGTLSNRKFRHERDPNKPENISSKARNSRGQVINENDSIDKPMLANTVDENPIASLMLQEGIDIHLRLGYSSDPDMLDGVFTGKIQAINFSDTEDLVTVIAQSHATELVQDVKGVDKAGIKTSWGLFGWDFWGFKQDASTGRIMEEMISQPEILHFGRWERGDTTANRSLLTNKWQFTPNPADDNIFAPPPSVDLELLSKDWVAQDLSYVIYRTTVWDIFKEMELRHPNFIGSPVLYSGKYGERMTYFFGLPNQLYFARHPTPAEQNAQDKIQEEADMANEFIRKMALSAHDMRDSLIQQAEMDIPLLVPTPTAGDIEIPLPLSDMRSLSRHSDRSVWNLQVLNKVLKKTINSVYRQKRLQLAKQSGYIQPFRKYHLFTSSSHIVANNIKADARDVANTIVIKYPKKKLDVGHWPGDISVKEEEATFMLKLDNALPTEDIRVQIAEHLNVTNDELAKRYALSILTQNIKDVYKGELIVIGDGSVNPYDHCFIFDEYSDITGAVEVEQVTHVFTREQGFLTEIVPDMVVAAAEWSLLSSTEALSMVMEGVLRKMFGSGNANMYASDTSQSLSPWSYIIGGGISLFGGMMAKKIINFTQLGQPVIMAPLLLHGREFSGGIPTRKIPASSWNTSFAEWKSEGDLSWNAWVEDFWDNIQKSITKYTGGYTTGSITKGWSHNTVDS